MGRKCLHWHLNHYAKGPPLLDLLRTSKQNINWGPYRLFCLSQTVLYCFKLRHSNCQCFIIWDLSEFKYKVISFSGRRLLWILWYVSLNKHGASGLSSFWNHPSPSHSRGCECPSQTPSLQHCPAGTSNCRNPNTLTWSYSVAGKAQADRKHQTPADHNQGPLWLNPPAISPLCWSTLKWAIDRHHGSLG